MSKVTYTLNIALLIAVIAVLAVIWQRPWQLGASVEVGSSYQSTTTPQVADRTNLCPQMNNVASSTTGTLGSVTIMTVSTGEILILDATTTDSTLRNGMATTTATLAHFVAGTGTTTVHFDIGFKRGLLVDYGASVATSTITYRCGS